MSFLWTMELPFKTRRKKQSYPRVHNFNFEWLQRPNIAISEMAQTLRENIPLIR